MAEMADGFVVFLVYAITAGAIVLGVAGVLWGCWSDVILNWTDRLKGGVLMSASRSNKSLHREETNHQAAARKRR